MASKGGAEHEVRYFRSGSNPGFAAERIKCMCDEMQREGWSPLSVSWTHERVAMLVFSRSCGKAK